MENTEPRKKNVPGVKEIIVQIKAISDRISSIDSEIRASQEQISSIIAAQSVNSPRAQLMLELKNINTEISEVKAERAALYDDLEKIKNSIEKLKSEKDASNDKTGINYNNVEDIDRKLEQLELKLISESISAAEEKKIASDLLNLRMRKNKIGEIAESIKSIKALEGSQKDVKLKIAQLSKVINEKTSKKNEIKETLDKNNSKEKTKTPEITRLESRIASLKAERPELLNKKAAKKEEIRVLEEEYAKFEKLYAEEKKLEEQRNKIREVISELKSKRDAIISEKNTHDPKIFDSLIFAVNNLKNTKPFTMDIDLVSSLIKYKAKIPSTVEDIETTIADLKKKCQEAQSSFAVRNSETKKQIDEFESKIQTEMAKLNELPPANIEILKKGNFNGSNKNKN